MGFFDNNAPTTKSATNSYTYQEAINRIRSKTGKNITEAQAADLFKQFGGDKNSTFTDEGLAPVIEKLGGTNYGGLGGDNPDPYVSNPNSPKTPGTFNPIDTPEYLAQPYVAPTWNQTYTAPTWNERYTAPVNPAWRQTPFTAEQFKAPTQAELESSPGYQSRLAAGIQAHERSAAANGSILNGGSQQELARYGQEYASNEYGNLFGQRLQGVNANNSANFNARGINDAEYNTDASNAYQAYRQNYGQFQDASAAGRDAYNQNYGQFKDATEQGFLGRQQNQNEFQTRVKNHQTNYENQNTDWMNRYKVYQNDNARTKDDYQANVTNRRNSNNDYWAHLKDLYDSGSNSANNSYKPGMAY